MATALDSPPAIPPQTVGNQFILQYYHLLSNSPEIVHKFYRETSVLSWPDADGTTVPTTTFEGIKNKIESFDSKNCTVEIKTADAQDSHMGGVIVLVTGLLTRKNNMARHFTQTFFLARQDRGYDVLNDIFQFVDIPYTPTTSVVNDVVEDSPASTLTQDPVPASVDHIVENQATAPAVNINDTEGTNSETSTRQGPVIIDVAAAAAAKAPVNSMQSQVQQEDAKKVSYASMLAKEKLSVTQDQVSSANVVRVVPASNGQKKWASVKSKPCAPQNGDAPRSSVQPGVESTSSPVADVARLALSSNDHQTHTSAVPNNSAAHTNYPPQDKGVYVGGLPTDMTSQELLDMVQKFGPVKRGGIQIKRYPDGFGFGFVEFESADSARSAIAAGRISFGDNNYAYISEKRSSVHGGNGRGRFPSARAGPRNDNLKGRDFSGEDQGVNGETYWNETYQNGGNGKAYRKNGGSFQNGAGRPAAAGAVSGAARRSSAGNGEAYRRNWAPSQNGGKQKQ